MHKKRIFIILCLLICILSCAFVSAADSDVTDEDIIQSTDEIDETISQTDDEFSSSDADDSDVMADDSVKENDNVLSATDENVLSETTGNITSLKELITKDDQEYIVLDRDYQFDSEQDWSLDGEYAIGVNKNLNIDGRGHTIDLEGMNKVFIWLKNGCNKFTLNNLTIKNSDSSVIRTDYGLNVDVTCNNVVFDNINNYYIIIEESCTSNVNFTNVDFINSVGSSENGIFSHYADYVNLILSNVNFRDSTTLIKINANAANVSIKDSNFINLNLNDNLFDFSLSYAPLNLDLTNVNFENITAYSILPFYTNYDINANFKNVNFTNIDVTNDYDNSLINFHCEQEDNVIDVNFTDVNFKDNKASKYLLEMKAAVIKSNFINVNFTDNEAKRLICANNEDSSTRLFEFNFSDVNFNRNNGTTSSSDDSIVDIRCGGGVLNSNFTNVNFSNQFSSSLLNLISSEIYGYFNNVNFIGNSKQDYYDSASKLVDISTMGGIVDFNFTDVNFINNNESYFLKLFAYELRSNLQNINFTDNTVNNLIYFEGMDDINANINLTHVNFKNNTGNSDSSKIIQVMGDCNSIVNFDSTDVKLVNNTGVGGIYFVCGQVHGNFKNSEF